MRTRRIISAAPAALFALVVSLVSVVFVAPDSAQKLAPIVYTITFPSPASKTFNVEMTVPTEGRASVDLMMPVWSPGFYGMQNYADRLTMFMARADDGAVLDVQSRSRAGGRSRQGRSRRSPSRTASTHRAAAISRTA
jgi:Peptidase M61 N-terminal domain